MRKRIIIALAAAFVLPMHLNAQAVIESGASSAAMPFSRIDRNAVSVAMGTTALMNDIAATPFRASRFALDASFMDGVNTKATVGLGSRAGVSVLFTRCQGEEYTVTGAYGMADGTFTPSDLQAGVGAFFKVTENIALQGECRYLQSSLAEDVTYSAVSADVIASVKFGGISGAAGVRSLGGKVNGYSLPTSASFGAGYEKAFGIHRLSASLESDVFFTGGVRAAVGAQYSLKNIVSLRGGYNLSAGSMFGNFATVGAGFALGPVALNIAYLFGEIPTDSALCIGLGLKF